MNVPKEIIEAASSVASSLLPAKSASRYEREYDDFKKWQNKNSVIGVTEDVLLVYLNQLSARFSPNTLWAKWSMLKSCLEMKENAPVRRFQKVIAFLKRKNERHTPKQAKVLSKEEAEQFLLHAPDDQWLLAKIVTIFGIGTKFSNVVMMFQYQHQHTTRKNLRESSSVICVTELTYTGTIFHATEKWNVESNQVFNAIFALTKLTIKHTFIRMNWENI